MEAHPTEDSRRPHPGRPRRPRFLSAFGRDVNVPEAELTFDERTRHLSLGAAAGNRAQAKTRAKAEAILPEVLAAITENPGINTHGLREACKGVARGVDVDAAAQALRREGRIVILGGAGGNRHTAIDPPVSGVSLGVPDTPDTRVRVSIGTDTRGTHITAQSIGTRGRPAAAHSSPCPECGSDIHTATCTRRAS